MVVWTNGDAPTLPTTERPSVLAHSHQPSAVTTPISSTAVVGHRVGEHGQAAEDLTDVADEDAARLVLEPGLPVDLDRHLHGIQLRALRAGPHVGDAPNLVLQSGIGVPDHHGVQPRTGHHREALPVHLAHVENSSGAVQTDPHARLDLLRETQVGRQQVGGARRQDGEGDRTTGDRVDRALHRSVATPHEEEVDTGVDQLLDDTIGDVLALRAPPARGGR